MAGNVGELVDNGSYYEVLMADGKTYKVDKEYYSGTYTPTLTNVSNLDSSTAHQCQYFVVKNVVSVSGRIDVDPTTTNTSTSLGISLPVSSDIILAANVGGSAAANAVTDAPAAILGDTTNNRATVQWVTQNTTNHSMFFSFIYLIQ